MLNTIKTYSFTVFTLAIALFTLNFNKVEASTTGNIILQSLVTNQLDLVVDQSPYSNSIPESEILGGTSSGTNVADLLVIANTATHTITLKDVYIVNFAAPVGQQYMTLTPRLQEQKTGSFDLADSTSGAGIATEYNWTGLAPNDGTSGNADVVKLFVTTPNPLAFFGNWQATIFVNLTAP